MSKESKYIKSKPNILSILLERYPKKRWNYIYVAENPYGIEYIKNHPEKIWNTDLLNRNNNIDIEVVKLYRERYWNWDILSRMPNMSIEVIVSNPKLPWNLWQISKNPSVSVEDIEKYPDLPWNYNDLSSNPNITAEFIESHINYNWNWDKLFTNINLPESFVYKHLDPSTIKYHHPSWTSSIQYYIDNVDKINFLSLSRKENLTQEIIERYIDEDWDWYCISASNKNITVPFVEKYKKYFHFNYLSQNPIIRPELIENNLKEDWNWNWIAKNPGIPVEYTIRYIDIKNISWKNISLNPNISLEFVERYIDKIDFEMLSGNKFLYNDTACKLQFEKDIQKRKQSVNNEIKDIFCKDVCGEILKFVSYD